MKSRTIHRALAGSLVILWLGMAHGCAQIAGINEPASQTCGNGVKDADEEGVDCGGSCIGACPGEACSGLPDCASGVCGPDGKCAAPTCTDGIKNGKEKTVDCGGDCVDCAKDGDECDRNEVCKSDICLAGHCRPSTCFDNQAQPDETDKDCGGPCLKCNLEMCSVNGECASGRCDSTTHTCQCNVCAAVLSGTVPLVESALCPQSQNLLSALFACICKGKCATACNGCTPITSIDADVCKSCAMAAGGCGLEAVACGADKNPPPPVP